MAKITRTSGSGGVTDYNLLSNKPDILDIQITNPLTGQFLKYDGLKWINNSSDINHNDLLSIQGGNLNENYHLNFAKYSVVQNTSGVNSGDISLGTTNGLTLSSQQLSLGLSSTSTTGSLSNTDWNTFNSKEPAITTLSPSKGGTGASNSGNISWPSSGGIVALLGVNNVFTGITETNGIRQDVKIKNGDYLLTSSDEVVVFTVSSNASLPPASGSGQTFRIVCRDAIVTILPNGSDMIKGETYQTISGYSDFIFTDTQSGIWE